MSLPTGHDSISVSPEPVPVADAFPATFPVVIAGFCAFLVLYTTQPILPLLATIFHTTKIKISLTITAPTAGVALAAPLFGPIADRWGRKNVIVAATFMLSVVTLAAATSANLAVLIFWRFLQGIFTPGIFAVTVAYIQDEWPVARVGTGVSHYIAGTVMGGLAGRVSAGLIAAHTSWRVVFVVLGAANFLITAILAKWLRRERNFVPHRGPVRLFGSALEHCRNVPLAATYVVGFSLLFCLAGAFTYITFQLAGPLFGLNPASLGSIFLVYLAGAFATSISGRWIDRYGQRVAIAFATTLTVGGIALTLAHHLWIVLAGMAAFCAGIFIAQTAATGYIGIVAKHTRALAVGLYVTAYYVGGSFGGSIPAFAWDLGGWPACVALIAAVQIFMCVIALLYWGDHSANAELSRVTAPS